MLPEQVRGDRGAIKSTIEGDISDMAFKLQQDAESGSRLWGVFGGTRHGPKRNTRVTRHTSAPKHVNRTCAAEVSTHAGGSGP